MTWFELKKEVSIVLWRNIVKYYDPCISLAENEELMTNKLYLRDFKLAHNMLLKCLLCDVYYVCDMCPLYFTFEANEYPYIDRRCIFAKDGAAVEEAKIILKALEDLYV